ncbi:MAG: MBL fold metallo-hydrolase [Gemmatimonadales bacterium]|jgi:ribonuclease Z
MPQLPFHFRLVWLAAVTLGCAADSVPQHGGGTEIVLLGTGTPYPDPERHGPATAVVVEERVFLFDAGAGVMRRMNAAGLPISGVEAFFVTHLHSDHTLGYPDLILTSWIMRRTTPLQVYGPPGLQRLTDHLLAAWQEDIRVRIEGLEREPATGYHVAVHESAPGVVYDSAGVRVTALPVEHGNWAWAFGYRIDTPDRSVVISGDTRPSEALASAATGVDVLVHETYPAARVAPEDRPGGEFWPQYMREFHTSAQELGRLAARSQPGMLLLTHIVWMGGTPAEIVAAIRDGGYEGPVVVGEDLGRY